jgi:hypothetical protein
LAFAAILAALEPATIGSGLDNDVFDRRFVDTVLLAPPAHHARGEDLEGALGRDIDPDIFAHWRDSNGLRHFPSLH